MVDGDVADVEVQGDRRTLCREGILALNTDHLTSCV